MALGDEKEYPDKLDAGYVCLLALHDDLKQAYDDTHPKRPLPRRRVVVP